MTTFAVSSTLNRHWKDDKTNFGFRMLQKMGWEENTGLGKTVIGEVDAIHIKKREINLGLGMESISNRANENWSSTAKAFTSVLESLRSNYTTDEVKDKKKDKKEKKKAKKKEKETKMKKESAAIIHVGMKYKKRKHAKDFASKSNEDKYSVLGGH